MSDLIRCLFGERYCQWCHYAGATWFERLMGGDLRGKGKWWQELWWKWVFWIEDNIPVWKIALRIHDRFHES